MVRTLRLPDHSEVLGSDTYTLTANSGGFWAVPLDAVDVSPNRELAGIELSRCRVLRCIYMVAPAGDLIFSAPGGRIVMDE
jgi:hypothetical protein